MKSPAIVRSGNRWACGLALAAGLCLSGCASDPKQGYSFAPTHATNIHTIFVPVFQNKTYENGIEGDLTDALIKEIQKSTKWAIVSSSGADVELSGTITAAQLDRLSVRTQTGLVQEMSYRVRVDFELRDNRSGKVIASRKNFEGLDTFVPGQPSGERIEIGQVGAVQRLARQIVAELRTSW